MAIIYLGNIYGLSDEYPNPNICEDYQPLDTFIYGVGAHLTTHLANWARVAIDVDNPAVKKVYVWIAEYTVNYYEIDVAEVASFLENLDLVFVGKEVVIEK